jgi:alpha-amylase
MQTELKQPWIAVVVRSEMPREAPEPLYHGDSHDILLQGFHWESHLGHRDPNGNKKSWYRILEENADSIQNAGFTWVWFPPSCDSLAPQGYIPRRWNSFDTPFGSESELRAAIVSLGPVKAMADVVLNHRVGVHTGGADFADPAFVDNRAAICRDDESGVGTGNHDTGERHACGRDLDHTNCDVRQAIKTWLRKLKTLGFKGWRYDLVKGFHGRYVGEYNEASAPQLSIGEYFEQDRQKTTNWIDNTGGKSTAFDFTTRYMLYDATKSDDYSKLRSHNAGKSVPGGLIGFWATRSVTFLDNHDTEYRREKDLQSHNDPTRHFAYHMVDMGYVYLLTHPGIPSVFWSHYFEFGDKTRERISQLIRIRRQAGIHANSTVDIRDAGHGLYAAYIDGKVAIKLGAREWNPGSGWQQVMTGDKFSVWVR